MIVKQPIHLPVSCIYGFTRDIAVCWYAGLAMHISCASLRFCTRRVELTGLSLREKSNLPDVAENPAGCVSAVRRAVVPRTDRGTVVVYSLINVTRMVGRESQILVQTRELRKLLSIDRRELLHQLGFLSRCHGSTSGTGLDFIC
jgi:hypothetical protein